MWKSYAVSTLENDIVSMLKSDVVSTLENDIESMLKFDVVSNFIFNMFLTLNQL